MKTTKLDSILLDLTPGKKPVVVVNNYARMTFANEEEASYVFDTLTKIKEDYQRSLDMLAKIRDILSYETNAICWVLENVE